LSILTKIFVVLVTVLSVLLVALIVPFVANTENFRGQLADANRRIIAAEDKARDYQVEINAAQEAVRMQVEELSNKTQKLTSTINTLQSDLATARAEKQSETAKLAQLEASVSLLSAADDTKTKMLDGMQSELTERRDQVVKLDRQRIELSDRVNQLASDNEALSRNIRRTREQATAYEQALAAINARIQSLPDDVRLLLTEPDRRVAAVEGGVEPDFVIRGQVTKVEIVEGTTFVQINVGQNDRVEPNMKFYVHTSDNRFVGTIVISAVDTDAAAGRVVLSSGKINPGDNVFTGRS
jgi:predicted  nucleic acid-binding Zn-ribbon protein